MRHVLSTVLIITLSALSAEATGSVCQDILTSKDRKLIFTEKELSAVNELHALKTMETDFMHGLYEGKSPLIWATNRNWLELVQRLIAAGADLNAQDDLGNTALMLAIYKGNSDLAIELIRGGANVNVQNTVTGSSAIMMAPSRGLTPGSEALLHAGADVNLTNLEGETVLMAAAFSLRPDLVNRLIEAGAEVNHQSKSGETALLKAVSNGSIEVTDSLLTAGADVNLQNSEGLTALILAVQRACEWGDTDLSIIQSLIRAGANIQHQDRYGWTAEKVAISALRDDIIQSLRAGRVLN